MTITQIKNPKMGNSAAFYTSALKSAKSMACTLGLALAAFGTLSAQAGERPSVPQRPPLPAEYAPFVVPESEGQRTKSEKIQNPTCETLDNIPLMLGCTNGAGTGIYGAPLDEEPGGIQLWNGKGSKSGCVSLVSNTTGLNGGNEGYIDFATKWDKTANIYDGKWARHMIIRPSWKDNGESGNVGIGQDWPSDRLVVDGTIRGTNFRLEPNGNWSWGGFGGPGYGLGRGEIYLNAPNFSGLSLNESTRPVLLQGLNGVGIATEKARFALNANGTSCIGLSAQEIIPIAFLRGAAAEEYSLYVKKGLRTEKVKVDVRSAWADYVFAKDYQLPTLTEVQQHIDTKGHLPGVPSACEVESEGIDLAEMAKLQMQKIEELTLYILQQEARIKALEAKVADKE